MADITTRFALLPSGYTHEWKTRDGAMTVDRELGNLIHAAIRAWKEWNSLAEPKVQGISPDLDAAMQYLYRQCHEAEILLSGLAQGSGK